MLGVYLINDLKGPAALACVRGAFSILNSKLIQSWFAWKMLKYAKPTVCKKLFLISWSFSYRFYRSYFFCVEIAEKFPVP